MVISSGGWVVLIQYCMPLRMTLHAPLHFRYCPKPRPFRVSNKPARQVQVFPDTLTGEHAVFCLALYGEQPKTQQRGSINTSLQGEAPKEHPESPNTKNTGILLSLDGQWFTLQSLHSHTKNLKKEPPFPHHTGHNFFCGSWGVVASYDTYRNYD